MAEGTGGGAPAAPGAPGQAAAGQQAEQPRETKAQAAQRLKLDLGEGEREYDLEHLKALAQRGRKSSQILSKAEQRAQDVARQEAEYSKRLERLKSKDLREQRAALKEMGVDEMALLDFVAKEYTDAEKLTPEQKRIRELEQREEQREAEAKKAKEEEGTKAAKAEEEKHANDLSDLFMEVMEHAKLPPTSRRAVFPRLAMLYQAADLAGEQLDPAVAAERVKDALRAEHDSLFRKPDKTLDLDALEDYYSPEDWTAIQRRAVEKYRAGKGVTAPPAVQQQTTPQPQKKNGSPRGGNFWRDFKNG